MNEPLKRRNLLAVPSLAAHLPEEAIAAVAARNGFPAAPPPPVAAAVDSGVSRRKRQPTGRDHQFNVRLRCDTLDSSTPRRIPGTCQWPK